MANWKFAWLLKSYYVEYLSKIPRKEWIDMLKNEVRPAEDTRPWNMKKEEIPCHGERIVIEVRDGNRIEVVLYRPESAQHNVPVYFQMHGGGFCAGCAEIDDDLCMRLKEAVGCCVISIDYRLAPEYPYPTALNDCVDTVRYFVEHAQEYGLDTERMSIGGTDAGACLAAAVCMQMGEMGTSLFRSLALNCPSLDHSIKNVPGDSPVSVENYVMLNQCYCERIQEEDPLVSPVFADAAQMAVLPPVILVTAEQDFEAESAEDWIVRVQRQNVEATAKRFLGMGHMFTMNYPEYWGGKAAEEAIEFLAKGIKKYFK